MGVAEVVLGVFIVLLQPQNQSVVGSWLNQRDQGPDGHVSPKIEVLATAGNTESKGSICADLVPEAGAAASLPCYRLVFVGRGARSTAMLRGIGDGTVG